MANNIQNFVLVDPGVVLFKVTTSIKSHKWEAEQTSNSSFVKLGVSTVGCRLIGLDGFFSEPGEFKECDKLMPDGIVSGSAELALARGMEGASGDNLSPSSCIHIKNNTQN